MALSRPTGVWRSASDELAVRSDHARLAEVVDRVPTYPFDADLVRGDGEHPVLTGVGAQFGMEELDAVAAAARDGDCHQIGAERSQFAPGFGKSPVIAHQHTEPVPAQRMHAQPVTRGEVRWFIEPWSWGVANWQV